ncbi:hypothetical protein V8E53_009125 [Lactarius tabidus]
MASDPVGSHPEGSEDNLVHTCSEVSEKPYDQGDTGEPDDFLSPADMNTDIDPGMELEPEQPEINPVELEPGSPIDESEDFTWIDPNISDSEPPEDVGCPVEPVESDSDSDSDSDSVTAEEFHPILKAPLEVPTDSSLPEKEQLSVDIDQDDVSSL